MTDETLDDFDEIDSDLQDLVATEADLISVGATAPEIKVEVLPVEQKEETLPAVVTSPETARELDFQYMRENMQNVIEISMKSLEELAGLATQSQNSRTYEVLALLAKTIADAQRDLMKIHKEKAEIERKDTEPVSDLPGTTNNIMVVGTTSSLDEMIKKMIKKDA